MLGSCSNDVSAARNQMEFKSKNGNCQEIVRTSALHAPETWIQPNRFLEADGELSKHLEDVVAPRLEVDRCCHFFTTTKQVGHQTFRLLKQHKHFDKVSNNKAICMQKLLTTRGSQERMSKTVLIRADFKPSVVE